MKSEGYSSLEAIDFSTNSLTELIENAEHEEVISKEGGTCSRWYVVNQAWKRRMSRTLSSARAKAGYLAILGIVIRAIPEPWSEVIWEEIEDQLLEVIETTCMPFLCVIGIEDVREYLCQSSRQSQSFM